MPQPEGTAEARASAPSGRHPFMQLFDASPLRADFTLADLASPDVATPNPVSSDPVSSSPVSGSPAPNPVATHGTRTDDGGFDPTNDEHLEALACRLLSRFRDSDDVEAYILLVELCQDRLHQVALGITRRLGLMIDPDDLVATFMARLFTDARTPSGTASHKARQAVRHILSVAYTMMRYDALNQLRLMRRARERGHLFEESRCNERRPIDPSVAVSDREQHGALARLGTVFLVLVSRCFHSLGLRDRRILICRELEGLCYDEIAATLDLPRPQVGMILKRARGRLTDRVDRALDVRPAVSHIGNSGGSGNSRGPQNAQGSERSQRPRTPDHARRPDQAIQNTLSLPEQPS